MDPLTLVTLINIVLGVINTVVGVFQGWREWHAHHRPPAHPLDAPLRDIAQAIRESGGQT